MAYVFQKNPRWRSCQSWNAHGPEFGNDGPLSGFFEVIIPHRIVQIPPIYWLFRALRESEAGNGTEGKDDLPLELIFLSPVSAYARAFTTSAHEPFTSVIYRMRLFSAKSKTGEFLSQSVF